MAINYVLSWFGVLPSDYDEYDELAKINPLIWTDENIHFQDIVAIPGRNNVTDNDALKEAVMKYGAVAITYYVPDAPYINHTNGAQYYDGPLNMNHGVALVGWDDTYSASNFAVRPPGDGAWIIKNSWGTEAGDNGYYYVSYYDTCFAMIDSYAFAISNTEQYNKNYQYDLQGRLNGLDTANEYLNKFIAEDDDLIAAVGVYLDPNANYTIQVYVNGALKHQQTGVSSYEGFYTVKLNTYVPIKKGDTFIVKIKAKSAVFLQNSRQHYKMTGHLYCMRVIGFPLLMQQVLLQLLF